MTGFLALIRIELLTVSRDRWFWVGVVVVVAGAIGFRPLTDRMPPLRPPAPPAAVCGDVGPWAPLALAVEGVAPADLGWGPWVERRPDAPLTVVFSDDAVPTWSVRGTGDVARAEACVEEALERAGEVRLARLGLELAPGSLVAMTAPAPAPLPPVSLLGVSLAGFGALIAGSFAVEAVPRRRASGLLEQLRSTRTTELEVVSAWGVAATIGAMLTVAAGGGARLALDAFAGAPLEWAPLVHVAPFVAQVAAVSVVTSLGASDTQASALRWFAALTMVAAGCGLAGAVYDQPALAACVPFGGSGLASAGWLGGWAALASVAGLGWAAGWTALGAWLLRTEDSSAAGVDLGLQRRARGNFGPEILVLAAIGVACGLYASAAASGSSTPWFAIGGVFAATMVVPSIATPAVVGVPRAELLPLAAPRAWDLGWAVPAVVGLAALGPRVMAASMAVIPSNDLIDGFVASISALAVGPWAVVAFGVIPGLCEELLYRGVIYGLARRGLGPWGANVVQAALFATAHLVSIRLPWTFALGLALGEVRRRTGTLWVCVAMHTGFNVLAAGGDPSRLPLYAAALIGAIALIGHRRA